MKTIFVTSFHPHISRNILSTKAFKILRSCPDLRIVLVVPAYKREYFLEHFGGPDVAVEGIQLFRASRTRRGLFFKKLAIFLFDSRSARNLKRYQFYLNRNFIQYVLAMVFGVVGHSDTVRAFVRFLDLEFSPKGFFIPLLERYKPDVILSTDVQNENDVSLMQDARDRRIPIVAMVRSWDNLTLRILRIFPDYLLLGSQTLAEEVDIYHRYPHERMSVVGNPHYDGYRRGPAVSKEEFLRRFGLDPKKKLILYAPVSNSLIRVNDIDQYVMEFLAALDINILVRFPPEKGVWLNGFVKPLNMAYDMPGAVFKSDEVGDREIRPEDDESLLNELSYSDVVITGPTSICLDSMFFDRPVIAVNVYPTPRPFLDTVWRYKDNHIQKILGTGGVTYVETKEEFLYAIDTYLAHPEKDAEGRARARALWFSHADGKAGERIAGEIFSVLGLTAPKQP